jgi:hypothetical protein
VRRSYATAAPSSAGSVVRPRVSTRSLSTTRLPRAGLMVMERLRVRSGRAPRGELAPREHGAQRDLHLQQREAGSQAASAPASEGIHV